MSGNLVPFPRRSRTYVIDTWPVMEWLKDRQPVAAFFDSLIEKAELDEVSLHMSPVNLGEVYYNIEHLWGSERAEETLIRVQSLPIYFAGVSNEEILAAARLKATFKSSYADGFAARLAIVHSCPIITGDRDFLRMQATGLLQVEWLGE